MRISDWSSDVCSSDLKAILGRSVYRNLAEIVSRQVPPRITIVWDKCVHINQCGYSLGQPIRDAADYHSGIAMTAQDNVRQVLIGQNVSNIQNKRSEERRVGKSGFNKCKYRG